MVYHKPNAELRRLHSFAAPMDRDSTPLRPGPMRRDEPAVLLSDAERVSSVDEFMAWCRPEEAGNGLMYARWRAVSDWATSPSIKNAAGLLAVREMIRIAGNDPGQPRLSPGTVQDCLRALAEWEAEGRPGFVPKLAKAQRLILKRRAMVEAA